MDPTTSRAHIYEFPCITEHNDNIHLYTPQDPAILQSIADASHTVERLIQGYRQRADSTLKQSRALASPSTSTTAPIAPDMVIDKKDPYPILRANLQQVDTTSSPAIISLNTAPKASIATSSNTLISSSPQPGSTQHTHISKKRSRNSVTQNIIDTLIPHKKLRGGDTNTTQSAPIYALDIRDKTDASIVEAIKNDRIFSHISDEKNIHAGSLLLTSFQLSNLPSYDDISNIWTCHELTKQESTQIAEMLNPEIFACSSLFSEQFILVIKAFHERELLCTEPDQTLFLYDYEMSMLRNFVELSAQARLLYIQHIDVAPLKELLTTTVPVRFANVLDTINNSAYKNVLCAVGGVLPFIGLYNFLSEERFHSGKPSEDVALDPARQIALYQFLSHIAKNNWTELSFFSKDHHISKIKIRQSIKTDFADKVLVLMGKICSSSKIPLIIYPKDHIRAPCQKFPLYINLQIILYRPCLIRTAHDIRKSFRPYKNGYKLSTDNLNRIHGLIAKIERHPYICNQVIGNTSTTEWLNLMAFKSALAIVRDHSEPNIFLANQTVDTIYNIVYGSLVEMRTLGSTNIFPITKTPITMSSELLDNLHRYPILALRNEIEVLHTHLSKLLASFDSKETEASHTDTLLETEEMQRVSVDIDEFILIKEIILFCKSGFNTELSAISKTAFIAPKWGIYLEKTTKKKSPHRFFSLSQSETQALIQITEIVLSIIR